MSPRLRVLDLAVAMSLLGLAGLGAAAVRATSGPDVTVITVEEFSLPSTSGAFKAYAIGTTSCNVGDQPVWWCNDPGDAFCETNQHPVIAQNLYRLKGGRFEQIGMSWLKHGFLSTNSFDPACGSCQGPPHGGDQLGVGCTDYYDSGLNGSRPLGMRSEVDPATGAFPYPPTSVAFPTSVDQRLKVLATDLDPALNVGARYFGEGQYIAADDAAIGNDLNNASYKEVAVNASYQISQLSPTVREQPAIFAWAAIDASVEIENVDFPRDGGTRVERFHVARKVTTPGAGVWHYEYAVHNLNAARAARAFTVRFPQPTTISNVGFRDVDHHSGEPYATTDWVPLIGASSVEWSTDDYGTNPNANALRWGTMFSFWFDADQAPSGLSIEITGFQFFHDGFESGDLSQWSAVEPP